MSPRIRFLISSFLLGVMSVGLAWAGAALTPALPGAKTARQSQALEGTSTSHLAAADFTGEPGPGQILAGAAKANIAPRPTDFGGTEWRTEGCTAVKAGVLGVTDPRNSNPADYRVRWLEGENCIYSGGFDLGPAGPIKKFDETYGLWARSVALRDATGDTLIMTILDGAYYFGEYNNMCGSSDHTQDPTTAVDDPRNDCGFFDIAEDLGAEFGIPAKSFMLSSTHSHSSPDFVGAWGGVPQWYMDQVEAAIKASIRAAVDMMRPAVLEVGDTIARQFNNDRRDAYRSAEEQSVTWFRLLEPGSPTPDPAIDYNANGQYSCGTEWCPAGLDAPASATSEAATSQSTATTQSKATVSEGPKCDKSNGNRPKQCPTPSPTPEPTSTPTGEPSESPSPEPSQTPTTEPSQTPTPEPSVEPTEEPVGTRAIATIGAYAAHPTSSVGGEGIGTSDWMGPFEKAVEEEFGGVGLAFNTGLGNMSRSGNVGGGLAALLPDIGTSRIVQNGDQPLDLTTAQTFWTQPVTNAALAMAGVTGIFDRPMNQTPAFVRAGKNAAEQCVSSSPVSVRTAASAAKIGDLWITGGPGELFSNLTNTIKEKNPRGVTLPLALVNDGLGYIMQSFETDHTGRQALGFGGSPAGFEYEDAYSIDHCFGDMVLEVTLDMLGEDDANWVSQPQA